MKKYGLPGDFKYVLIERIMLKDFKLSSTDSFIMTLHRLIDHLSIPEVRALELDSTNTVVEQVPIIVNQPIGKRISAVKRA